MILDSLLVEIGTEELPPKALKKLAMAFAENMELELKSVALDYSNIEWLATPRRLAILINQLEGQQKDKVVEKRGPAITAAFDAEGAPTKAAQGWARSNGITIEQAERLTTGKGEWLLHKAKVVGLELGALLPEVVNKALSKLPIPKPMKWGDHKTQFIRPVHTVTMMYGDKLIEGSVLGKASTNKIKGHRFHGQSTIELLNSTDYKENLKKQYVIADFNARKAIIREEIEKAATVEGATADINEELLDEVTSLVEWPVVLTASFEDKFLDVPKEALIYTMKDDQKYFPLLDKNGNLLSRFVFVTNIESKQPSRIIEGNEKVIRPRLADAEFFYKTDKRSTLESRLSSLDSVLFQKQLGTLKDKSERIAQLADIVAQELGADNSLANRAGILSKTDLMTEMVMEFPEVQGVMGMYYARNDGEDPQVALALNEQYMPRFAGDSLPKSPISCALAIADKIDTLVGIFGIGQIPKGDKDPFALRRAAIGIIRIVVENHLALDLETLISESSALFGDRLTNANVNREVTDFVLGRFRAWYQDQGVEVNMIQSVLARRPTKPADFDARIQGIKHFVQLDEADSLAAANKRVANILAKNNVSASEDINFEMLVEVAEKELASKLLEVEKNVAPYLSNGDYREVLALLATLRASIDNFFDNVMVMSDDDKLRQNRLALLYKLRWLFLEVADISLLNS